MPWVKIDDHFDEHPKLQQVGPLGWGVWLAGLAYCNRNLTDGFIPWSKARTLCSFEVVEDDGKVWDLSRSSGMVGDDITAEWVITLLVDAGLWEEVDNGRGRITGYRIHDYGDFQPSKDEVLAERAKNAERQQRFRERKSADNAVSNDASSIEVTDNVTPLVTRDKRTRNEAPVPVPVPVPDSVPERDSVSHETAQKRAPRKVTESEPFLVWSAGCEIAGVSIQDAAGSKDRQCGKIKQLLKHHCRDDLLTCFAWLHDDRLEVERGVDWFRVEARIGGWINKGKPPPRRQQQSDRSVLVEMGGVRGYIDR